jgi:hypothetical protein
MKTNGALKKTWFFEVGSTALIHAKRFLERIGKVPSNTSGFSTLIEGYFSWENLLA